jgi:hypothetical protein
VISVTKADFGTSKPTSDTADHGARTVVTATGTASIGNTAAVVAVGQSKTNYSSTSKTEAEILIEQKLRAALPAESLTNTNTVALLSNVYDPLDPACVTEPDFFVDLQVSRELKPSHYHNVIDTVRPVVFAEFLYHQASCTDLIPIISYGARMRSNLLTHFIHFLEECCKYGKVLRLVLPEGPLFEGLGCVAVTFDEERSAVACTQSLEGRRFDGRVIETMVFRPPPAIEPMNSAIAESKTEYDDQTTAQVLVSTEAVDIATAGAEVDDFLNSLL